MYMIQYPHNCQWPDALNLRFDDWWHRSLAKWVEKVQVTLSKHESSKFIYPSELIWRYLDSCFNHPKTLHSIYTVSIAFDWFATNHMSRLGTASLSTRSVIREMFMSLQLSTSRARQLFGRKLDNFPQTPFARLSHLNGAMLFFTRGTTHCWMRASMRKVRKISCNQYLYLP